MAWAEHGSVKVSVWCHAPVPVPIDSALSALTAGKGFTSSLLTIRALARRGSSTDTDMGRYRTSGWTSGVPLRQRLCRPCRPYDHLECSRAPSSLRKEASEILDDRLLTEYIILLTVDRREKIHVETKLND